MKRITAIATAGVFAATAGFAATMEEIDTDADGMLSLVEFQAIYPEVTEDQFVTADLNADGLIDADELAAAQEAELLPMTDDMVEEQG